MRIGASALPPIGLRPDGRAQALRDHHHGSQRAGGHFQRHLHGVGLELDWRVYVGCIVCCLAPKGPFGLVVGRGLRIIPYKHKSELLEPIETREVFLQARAAEAARQVGLGAISEKRAATSLR
jgi:hypothetical protein